MRRIILVLTTSVLSITVLRAQPITQQEAMERVIRHITANNTQMRAPMRGVSQLEPAHVEADKIYAFNIKGGGYIIASADARTLPVLGYSSTGSIDWDTMPDNMRAWLQQYDDAVASLGSLTDFQDGQFRGSDGQLQTNPQSGHEPIEPLISTHWGQDAPYNGRIPLYGGNNPNLDGQPCKTGCSAVAMAQIMNYYKWPKSLSDGIPAYISHDNEYGIASEWTIDSIPPFTFDWDNMLNDYTVLNPETRQRDTIGTDAQRNAVSVLMRYCGQSLKVIYTPLSTGANSLVACQELVNRFNYPAATWLYRDSLFGIDQWEDIVYGELAAGRPLYYSASDERMGGHAFICDGYDGNGLFHINWGWDSDKDGYYSLSVLAPFLSTDKSVGSEGLGFSSRQKVIIYTDPHMEPQPAPKGCLDDETIINLYDSIWVESVNMVHFIYAYNGDDATHISADYAFGTIDKNGLPTPLFPGDPNDSIVYPGNLIDIEIDSTSFLPGQSLKLYPMIKFRLPDEQWQVIPPKFKYIEAGRSNQGRFFITPHSLEMKVGTITGGTGRLGQPNDLTITFRNPSDVDFSDYIQIRPQYYGHIDQSSLTDDTPYTKGDQITARIYVKAGQEFQATLSFTPVKGGLTEFACYSSYRQYLGSFYLNLDNDTLTDYRNYLDNNSRVVQEDGQWIYELEICDKAGIPMDYPWMPASGIYIEVAQKYLGEKAQYSSIPVQDYLKALPDHCGSGDYKFTYRLPLNLDREGDFAVFSYLMYWIDESQNKYILTHFKTDTIHADAPAGISLIKTAPQPDRYYDLQGRALPSIPTEPGIYLRRGKKEKKQ